jgi:hypothetical protein
MIAKFFPFTISLADVELDAEKLEMGEVVAAIHNHTCYIVIDSDLWASGPSPADASLDLECRINERRYSR